MDRERAAAGACVVACGLTVVLAVVPYLLALPATVSLYYRITPVGPPLAALFAVIAAIVVVAGATGRFDPATAAGVGLVLGLVVAVVAWWWAPSVAPSTVASVSANDAFGHHRWLVALAGTAVAATAAWYAAAVLRAP